MMKTTMRLLLMAVLTGSLGMGVAACSSSSDDADNRLVTKDGKTYVPDSLLTDEERYQMAAANVAASVVRNLTGSDVSLDQLEGKTFEPAYGLTLDGEGSMVRAKQVRSTDDAEDLFRELTGIYDETTERLLTATPDGYELSLRDLTVAEGGKRLTLGTLTFHRDGGNRYGYVEVSMPCIPHLERIDYLSAEAFPDNANCPYQVGDVVNVNHDDTGYCGGYYLCVATTAYQSTLVHLCKDEVGGYNTVNFDNDDAGCWVPYNGVKKNDKTTLNDIKDYVYFIANNQAKVAAIKAFMRGEAYDQKPRWHGELHHLFPGGFDNEQGVAFDNPGSAHPGGYILYDAYYGSYHAGYAYYYRHCIYADIPNRCTSGSQVVRKEYKYVADRDWRKSWTGYDNFCMNVIHTDRLIVGATLELSATKTLEFGMPAKAATADQLGWCYADDGYLYETADKARKYGHTPLGAVAFVNTGKAAWMDLASEKAAGYGHGLVMSYDYANDGDACAMNPVKDGKTFTEEIGFDKYIDQSSFKTVMDDFDGLFRTQELAENGSPAAKAARATTPQPRAGVSDWFIPSTGQWLAILCNDRQGGKSGLGDAPWPDESENYDAHLYYYYARVNIRKSVGNFDFGRRRSDCWTTSAVNDQECIYMTTKDFSLWFSCDGNEDRNVFPVFAF